MTGLAVAAYAIGAAMAFWLLLKSFHYLWPSLTVTRADVAGLAVMAVLIFPALVVFLIAGMELAVNAMSRVDESGKGSEPAQWADRIAKGKQP